MFLWSRLLSLVVFLRRHVIEITLRYFQAFGIFWRIKFHTWFPQTNLFLVHPNPTPTLPRPTQTPTLTLTPTPQPRPRPRPRPRSWPQKQPTGGTATPRRSGDAARPTRWRQAGPCRSGHLRWASTPATDEAVTVSHQRPKLKQNEPSDRIQGSRKLCLVFCPIRHVQFV